jgi:hypothetical protein
MGVLLVLHCNDRRLAVRRYLLLLLIALVAGWSAVAATMSFSRLRDTVHYSATTAAPEGLAAKLGRGIDLLADNRWYSLLCLAAVVLGFARHRLPPVATAVVTLGLVALAFMEPPVLFIRSHDVVTLLALTGIGLVWDLRPDAAPAARSLGMLFSVSFVAGLITMLTAATLLFNFCIGAAFAASLAFAVPAATVPRVRVLVSAIAGLGVVGVVLTTSLTSFYGDTTAPGQERERISGGFFAGMRAAPDDVRLLQVVSDRVVPLLRGQAKVVFIGRNPGLMLATPTRLLMPSSYPVAAPTSPGLPSPALVADANFYSSPSHRPPIVIIYRDGYFTPANPIGARFAQWYALAQTEKTPIGTLEIYHRR